MSSYPMPPLTEEEKKKTPTDNEQLIKDHPERYRKKRTQGSKKPRTGTPSVEEWSKVSRMVFNNAIEMLTERDEETGRLLCTPQLLTSVTKLITESNTVFEIEKDEVNTLSKQLKNKRAKRKLRLTDEEVPEPSNLGYQTTPVDSEARGRSVLHIDDKREG